MLKGLKEKWIAVPNQSPRLLNELDITIAFLEKEVPVKLKENKYLGDKTAHNSGRYDVKNTQARHGAGTE